MISKKKWLLSSQSNDTKMERLPWKKKCAHRWMWKLWRTWFQQKRMVVKGDGSRQHTNKNWKCFQHLSWVNSEKLQQSRQSRQDYCNQKLESFRAKYLGSRCAQETECKQWQALQIAAANQRAISTCTVWKGLELKDWFLLLHLHTQTGITDRNITFEGPRKFYVFIYLHLFYFNVRQFY